MTEPSIPDPDLPADGAAGARRVVLVDFDWQDADLLPALFRRPELSIRLVAGERRDTPGLRVAELCGLPHTMDLADLTREIFDLALVSERSPRRTQVEGLLQVLGTPCATPTSFLDGVVDTSTAAPSIETPMVLHAAALESTLGGESMEEIVDQALPDLVMSPEPGGGSPPPLPATGPVGKMTDFPSPEDRHGLEVALQGLVTNTGASGAELRAGRDGDMKLVAQVGQQDEMMKGLMDLALQLDKPQVIQQLSGHGEGKAWGAWPFRTAQQQGVLGAAAIDPAEGWTKWERTVEELRTRWDERDRSQSAALVPERQVGWLDREEFRNRIDLAVERWAIDGTPYTLHRLTLPESRELVEAFCRALPDHLRDTDYICRPVVREVLILCPYMENGWEVVITRLRMLLEHTWEEMRMRGAVPAMGDDEARLSTAMERASFVQTASGWLHLD